MAAQGQLKFILKFEKTGTFDLQSCRGRKKNKSKDFEEVAAVM